MTLSLAPPECCDRGQGPPLVLLHCLGANRWIWNAQIDGLQGAFRTLSYDLPGHGSAPVPREAYAICDLADQLAAMLVERDLEPAHIVGMSLGGLIAQDFVVRYPTQAASLVLIDTVAQYPEPMRAQWLQRAMQARTTGMSSLVQATLAAWFTPEFLAGDDETIRFVSRTLTGTSALGYALACEALAAADLTHQTDAIRVPTLIVCGSDDGAPFQAAARDFAARIRGSRLHWLTPARHAGVLEHPTQTTALLQHFLLQQLETSKIG